MRVSLIDILNGVTSLTYEHILGMCHLDFCWTAHVFLSQPLKVLISKELIFLVKEAFVMYRNSKTYNALNTLGSEFFVRINDTIRKAALKMEAVCSSKMLVFAYKST
jgi:hypothetical protein